MDDADNANRKSTEMNKPVILDKTESRQGVTLHSMRYVLVLGIIGALIGMAMAGYYYFG